MKLVTGVRTNSWKRGREREREREGEEKKLLNFFDKFALIYTAVSPLYFFSKGKKVYAGEVGP